MTHRHFRSVLFLTALSFAARATAQTAVEAAITKANNLYVQARAERATFVKDKQLSDHAAATANVRRALEGLSAVAGADDDGKVASLRWLLAVLAYKLRASELELATWPKLATYYEKYRPDNRYWHREALRNYASVLGRSRSPSQLRQRPRSLG